jgi:hypothetical protein
MELGKALAIMGNSERGQGLSRIIGNGHIVMIIGPIDTDINHGVTSSHEHGACRVVTNGVEAFSDPVDGLIWVVISNHILSIIQFRGWEGRGVRLWKVIV